jgi:hypothetical protein
MVVTFLLFVLSRPSPDLDFRKLSHSLRTKGRLVNFILCEISSSHGGEYDVQSCLLGYTAV